MARALDEMGVPVTMVLDAGVAYCMSRYALGVPQGTSGLKSLKILLRLACDGCAF